MSTSSDRRTDRFLDAIDGVPGTPVNKQERTVVREAREIIADRRKSN